MFAFTMRRLLFAVPTLIVISFIIFALLDLSPGDPTANLPLTIPADVREQIRQSLGLDLPAHGLGRCGLPRAGTLAEVLL